VPASPWRLAATLAMLLGLALWAAPLRVRADTPPGPPFPDPVSGRFVYDQAGLFSPAAIAEAEATIVRIRERTGAEVVVYTQLKPDATTESTEQDALALINQWGVGRRGFDDGLAILANVYRAADGTIHGQVQLYAAPGFQALYLTNEERQRIYDDDMLPLLREQRFDDALLVAMRRTDEAATADKAARLQAARQIDAVIGIGGGIGSFLLLGGYALFHWRRYGRDPYVVDSPSIYLPAPPPELTAAGGALLLDGRSSRRTLTTALLDLASRDEIAFRVRDRLVGRDEVTVEIHRPRTDDPRIALNRRQPISLAEETALRGLDAEAKDEGDGDVRVLDRAALLEFGRSVGTFDAALEDELVRRGWFARSPRSVTGRWTAIAVGEIVAGGIAFWLGQQLPSGGFTLLAIGLAAAGAVTLGLAFVMPARTLTGATLKVMLAAYGRSLAATMAGARSMEQVVAEPRLAWLETPDRAVVWGVALGQQKGVEQVLERSIDDLRSGRVQSTYVPAWYGGGSGGGGGGGGTFAPGLMSSSAVPSISGMFAALGTIGNSPSSGGGFGGGGGGGGGGGAGGGF